MLKTTTKSCILCIVGFVIMISSTSILANTSRLTVDKTNELYTRMAANGQGVDDDGKYGMQCVDIPYDITHNYVGKPIHGNAIDLLDSARSQGYEITNQPEVGSIFVMDTTVPYGHPFGHTGYIWKVNPDGSFETVEQNVGDDSNLFTGTVAKYQHRTMDYMLGFIKINYRK